MNNLSILLLCFWHPITFEPRTLAPLQYPNDQNIANNTKKDVLVFDTPNMNAYTNVNNPMKASKIRCKLKH